MRYQGSASAKGLGSASASAKPVEETPSEPHAQGKDPDREHVGVVRGRGSAVPSVAEERIVVVETWHYVVVQVPVMVPMMWQPWDHSGHYTGRKVWSHAVYFSVL